MKIFRWREMNETSQVNLTTEKDFFLFLWGFVFFSFSFLRERERDEAEREKGRAV
jgi:hypothetical protein